MYSHRERQVRAVVSWLKDILGDGYIQAYYEQLAEDLLHNLELAEDPQYCGGNFYS